MVWVFVRLFKRLPLDETVCLHSLRYILKSHTKLWAGILDPPSESSQSQKSPPWSASHHSLKCMLACVELWYMNTWKRSCCTSNHYLLPGTKFRQDCTPIFTAYVLSPKKKAHLSYGLYNLLRVVSFVVSEKAERNMQLLSNMLLFTRSGGRPACISYCTVLLPVCYTLELPPVYVISDGIFGWLRYSSRA